MQGRGGLGGEGAHSVFRGSSTGRGTSPAHFTWLLPASLASTHHLAGSKGWEAEEQAASGEERQLPVPQVRSAHHSQHAKTGF